ncbi:LuxR C-terminal-related transcriptional regulator [Streptomyces achromogenes]|uniref:LuxR C-terminal-related transcriptional regulator n=1 Tax=Streptomyces achromogenes TaxID=67255 RepID=UPI003700A925
MPRCRPTCPTCMIWFMSGVPSNLCAVTVRTRDVPGLRRFYRGLGWPEVPSGDDGRAEFLLGGVLLVLRSVNELAAEVASDAQRASGWTGITLTCPVDSSEQVDAVFAAAMAAGATAVEAPADRPAGSRSACIADPEGNRWEIAWTPPTEWRAMGVEVPLAPRTPDEPHQAHAGAGGRPQEPAAFDAPSRDLPAVDPPLPPAAVHRAIAERLHLSGAPDETVALHLVAAGGSGPDWAAETLRCAALTALGEGRQERAVSFLRRALAEPLSPNRRGSVLTELGSLEVKLGPAERAAGVRHLAASVRLDQQSDVGVFKAANALGAALVARGQTSTAMEVMEDLAERFTGERELSRAVQGAAALIASHDGRSWLDTVDRLRRPTNGGSQRPAPLSRALLAEFNSTSGRSTAVEAAAIAREVTAQPQDLYSRTYVLASAATLAQWADDLELADRLVADGMTGHRGPSADPGYQSLLSVRAESLAMRGSYQELLAACHSWGILAGSFPCPTSSGWDNTHLVAQAIIALTETGRIAEARRLADSVPAGGSRESWEWNEFLYARGLLSFVEGAPAAALDDLLECGRRQTERQVISPIVTPWRSAAADCQLLLGRPSAAIALADEELETARRWGTPRCIGRAMRALGTATGGRTGLAAVEQAVDLLRTTDTTPELISALISYGVMLTGAGHRTAARRALREAVRHAERIDASRSRSAASEMLAAAGARRSTARQAGAHALTSSERRICELASQGHSNAEIAALLHLALRTVETHLTSSFRKLGVQRRTQLAKQLAAGPPAEAGAGVRGRAT